MKIWKKTLALVMALGMTAGFAACGGGKGDKEPAGEQLQGEGAWAAAWEATLTATNIKAEGYYNYSMYVNENLWATMESEGTIELADNKIYSVGYATQEYDYTAQGHGTGKFEGVTKYYYGMKDGGLYCWFYDEETKTWDEDLNYGDMEYFGTGYYLAEEAFEMDMDRYDYVAWEALATYADGVYTLSFAEDDESETYKFKFVDGKLYSFTCLMTEVEEDATITVEQSFTFSYGDAKIGKLPYEEGFENEKPEEGGDVGGGTVGGEEIGGGGAVEAPDYSDVKGENVESVEEWNAILQNSFAETNFVGVEHGSLNGQTTFSTLYMQDGKAYIINEDSTVEGKSYRYIGYVDGVRYMWTSKDNATWNCEYDYNEEPLNASFAIGLLTGIPFEGFTYDADEGVLLYEATADGESGVIKVKIVDGKVVSYSMIVSGAGMTMTRDITVSYGTATVGELPPVENVGEGGNENIGDGVVDPNPSNPDNGKEEIDNGNSNVDFGGNGKEEGDNNSTTLK